MYFRRITKDATRPLVLAAFYQQPAEEITRLTGEVEALQAELDQAYQRWEALESAAP